jgi:tripartite ATP-independent transporter DctM subunit
MNVTLITIACLVALLIIMGFGIPFPYVLGFCAVVGIFLAYGVPGLTQAGRIPYSTFFKMDWTPLPLFVMLGCILNETRIGSDIFLIANRWLARLPGGLVIASIISEAVMAATIGSSIVTLLVVGKIAVPEMEKLGYNKSFSIAAILAGGILGPLIPPSVTMVIYAIFAQVSIGKLFIAGIIPGIILTVILCLLTITMCIKNPTLAPRKLEYKSIKVQDLGAAWKVWPVVVIILSILGGIYMGVMTATEAGGIAVVVTLILCVAFYHFRGNNLFRSMIDSALINGMICFIIVGALSLTFLIGTTGMAKDLASYITTLNISKWGVIIIINVIYLILGCFMDSPTAMMVTLPFFIPIIKSFGLDPIWFGVLVVVNIEIGLLTPPMALNLFVARQTFNEPIGKIIHYLVPYLMVVAGFLAIIIAFPQLSLWLPNTMK